MSSPDLHTLILSRPGQETGDILSVFQKENWPCDTLEIPDPGKFSLSPGACHLIILLHLPFEFLELIGNQFKSINIPIVCLAKEKLPGFNKLQEILPSLIDLISNPLDNGLLKTRLQQFFLTMELKKRIENLSRQYSHKTDELISALDRDKKNRDELKHLDKMKSDITSTISHELRTPISAMKGAVSTLQSSSLGTLNKEQQEFVNIIGRNADRLKSLVSDFLDFSRLNDGKTRLNFSLLPLSVPVLEAINTFKATCEEKDIKLTSDIPDNLQPVKFDNLKIIQVMNNLLNNALKFTPGNGKIHITLSAALESPGSVKNFQISVSDTGIGIPENQLSRIFEKFSQVDNTATRRYGGTGLGLSICKGIVTAHQGKIWAESIFNRGTTIHFTIPAMD